MSNAEPRLGRTKKVAEPQTQTPLVSKFTVPLDWPAELITTFEVPGEPVSKARARFTGYGSKVRAYTPTKTKEAEERFAASYLESANPATDKESAFGVEVEFLHETGQRRDVDNMLKAVLDGLNGIAWPDDVQVTSIRASKRRVAKGDALTRVSIFNLGRIEKPRGRCVNCGTEFPQFASTSSRKYCTRDCAYAARRASRERTCPNCGTAFLSPANGQQQTCCSVACNSQYKRVTLECVVCGDEYTTPRSLAKKGRPLCSGDCRATYHRRARRTASRTVCPDCGGPKSTKRAMRCRGCNVKANTRWNAKNVQKVGGGDE